MNTVEFGEAFEKALIVIDSCKNEEQLATANNYINNFFKTFAELDGEFLEADSKLQSSYNTLRVFLGEQRHRINY
jgi:hypothetical protein